MAAAGTQWLARALKTPEILSLICLPLILLCFDPNWIFPTLFHDPWIYLGYGLDPWRMMVKFSSMYYGGRLSITMPLALAHAILPPVLAHLCVHMTLYYISIFCIYAVVVRRLGQQTAYLAALGMGAYFYFLDAMGRDYIDASGITYFLLSCWCLSRAADSPRHKLWCALSGASTVSLVVVNLVYGILVPLVAMERLVCVPKSRNPRVLLADLGCFLLGSAVLFACFSLFYWRVVGDWFFLRSSFGFIRGLSLPGNSWFVNGRTISKFEGLGWLSNAVWLGLPLATVLPSVILVLQASRERSVLELKPVFLWPARFLLLLAILWCIEVLSSVGIALQIWLYSSITIPAMVLAWAAILSRATRGLSPGDWSLARWFSFFALAGQAVVPWAYSYENRHNGGTFLLTFIPASLGLVVPLVVRGSLSVCVTVVLLTLSMFTARIGFSEENSFPIFANAHPDYGFRPAEGPRRLLPYVRRAHQYDKYLVDVYRSITESVRYVRRYDKRNQVLYWFDMLDPHAMVYDNLACTRNWGHSIVNFNFPNVVDNRAFDHREFGAGQLIAIPSVHPDAYGFAKLALAGIGFRARLVDRLGIEHGAIHFSITLVELEQLEKKGRTPL